MLNPPNFKRAALCAILSSLFAYPLVAGAQTTYEYRQVRPGLTVLPTPSAVSPLPELSTTALSLGSVQLGQTATASVVLSNSGTGVLGLTAPPQVSGSGFSATTSCGGSLPAGQSCVAEILFSPTSAEAHIATLEFFSSHPQTLRVSLAGTGVYASSQVGALILMSPVAFSSSALTLTAPTSASSGAWAYTSSNPLVATISGNQLNLVGAGTTTITASQAAAGNYGPSQVSTSLTVQAVAPDVAAMSPVFVPPASSVTLTPPSSNSTGAWTYTSSNPAVFTVSGNILTGVGVGTATLTASQAASGPYLAGTTTTAVTVGHFLVNYGSYRAWSDGTFAQSCSGYRNPTGAAQYSGATGDGVYRIQPQGQAALDVYCDMTTDGGGWTMWYTTANAYKILSGGTNSTPFGTNGYSRNLLTVPFKEILYVRHSDGAKDWFTRDNGVNLTVSALVTGGVLNVSGSVHGPWTGKGGAVTSYKYQLTVGDNVWMQVGLMMSGIHGAGLWKVPGNWQWDLTTNYYRVNGEGNGVHNSGSYQGVAFRENGHTNLTNKLISVGIR